MEELGAAEYETLREAATTAREQLVLRLAAEAGLRPAEQAQLRLSDIDRRQFDGEVHHFLSVRGKDGTVRRRGYLPAGLARTVEEYAEATGREPADRLVDVTPRRIQMLISEVGDRAAKRTGDERFESVSSDALRRYFARRLLSEANIDPRVVCAVGGWDRLAALDDYVNEVDDAAIAAAFGAASGGSGDAGASLEGAAGAAMFELDADGRITDADGAVASLLGYDGDGLAGTAFGQLFTETARERARPREVLAAAGRDDVAVTECRLRRADGTETRLSALVCALRDGDRLEGFAVVLREPGTDSQQPDGVFERAIEAVGQPVCLATLDGQIERVNPAFEALLGYSRGEAVGRSAEDILSSGEDTDRYYEELRETVLEGETWTGEVTVRRKSGERVHVRQTVSPVFDDTGDVEFVVVVATDVTERVRSERALARRCETLERLEALVADINAAGRELIDASTRPEIEAAVCESLAESGAYAAAWVGGTDPGEPRVRPREWAGAESEADDAVAVESPAVETALDLGTPRVTAGDLPADIVGPFDPDAVEGYTAGVVPVAYGETTYGLLVVFTERGTAFGDRERTLLSDLGARIGHAVTAIERRNLLLADTVVELEFGCNDEDAFLVAATEAHDCTCSLEAVVPVSEESLLFYATLSGAKPDAVLDSATAMDGVTDGRYIREYDDRSLLEFTVEGNSPALTLTDLGATICEGVAEHGEQTIRAELPSGADVRSVVEGLRSVFPDTTLRSKHAVDQPVETVAEFQDSLAERLTDKQRAALRAAYFAGYFDWPRGSTAEEVADSMGVSSPTLHNHLRKAERKLLSAFFDHTGEHLGGEQPEHLSG